MGFSSDLVFFLDPIFPNYSGLFSNLCGLITMNSCCFSRSHNQGVYLNASRSDGSIIVITFDASFTPEGEMIRCFIMEVVLL